MPQAMTTNPPGIPTLANAMEIARNTSQSMDVRMHIVRHESGGHHVYQSIADAAAYGPIGAVLGWADPDRDEIQWNSFQAGHEAVRALQVIALDPKLREWLREADPMALQQVSDALMMATGNGIDDMIRVRMAAKLAELSPEDNQLLMLAVREWKADLAWIVDWSPNRRGRYIYNVVDAVDRGVPRDLVYAKQNTRRTPWAAVVCQVFATHDEFAEWVKLVE